MYVNKCIKCGTEFETKNPKRVICPNCLYPDKSMMPGSDSGDSHNHQHEENSSQQNSSSQGYTSEGYNVGGYSAGGYTSGGYSSGGYSSGGYSSGGYERPQRNSYNNQGGGYQSRGGYNQNRSQGNYQQRGGYSSGGYSSGGYDRPQRNHYNNQGGGYQSRGGYNQNRSQGNYQQRGGYNQNRSQGNYQQRRPNNFQQRRPMGRPQRPQQPKQLLISKEQLEQIAALYKAMLPLPNPDAHEVIGEKIGLEPKKVFFGINLVRQQMKLPKLPFPKRKLAISPDQLLAIKSLYEPLLPLPPIGCHKIIAVQLKMDEWRVHVGIGLIRSQMGLDRWNQDREDAPEEFKKSDEKESKAKKSTKAKKVKEEPEVSEETEEPIAEKKTRGRKTKKAEDEE